MPKYIVSWQEDVSYDVEIEASSGAAAIDKWRNGEYDVENVAETGGSVNLDSVDCEAI